MSFLGKVYSGSVWETRVDLQAERFRPELERMVLVGDAWWYRTVAVDGYDVAEPADRPPNWAFFPLYPRLTAGLRITDSFALNGMIVSNIGFFASLVLLGLVAIRSGLPRDAAERAIYYLAFFPTSYFFSMPVTESLFLALSLGSIFFAHERRWWLAGTLGGLAALTRFQGILLVVPLALMFFRSRRRSRWELLWLGLIPAGTAFFMWELNGVAGDPLAFVHAQSNWGRAPAFFLSPFASILNTPATVSTPWNFVVLNVFVALLLVVAGVIWLLRREWPLGAYTIVSVLLPLSTGSIQSVARYTLVVFPAFLLLSMVGRKPAADRIIIAVSAALFGWLTALMALRVDFALA